LDLSQAQLAAPQVTLTKLSLLGGVSIGVPPGIRVEASGFSLIGGTSVDAGPEPGPGAPTVHIRAFSLLGGPGSTGQSRPANCGVTGAGGPSRATAAGVSGAGVFHRDHLPGTGSAVGDRAS